MRLSNWEIAILSSISVPSDPHLRRWMLFVDGENLTIRAQTLAEHENLGFGECTHYLKDVFIWFPGVDARQALVNSGNVGVKVQRHSIRSYYYTSLTGSDEKIEDVRNRLWELGFQPKVFKKRRKDAKAKGVDIALATDFLSNAYNDNFDVAVLIAGDGDYLPMVEEAKRLGKIIYLSFFNGEDLGLSPSLKLASDRYFDFTEFFITQWKSDEARKPF